ncbi:MAG: beta-Ala-His dipeptidase [Bacteriovoracaceae bacterium]
MEISKDSFAGLDSAILWDKFIDFTKTPRPSGYEELILDYLVNFAKERKLNFFQDEKGNLSIHYDPAGVDPKTPRVIIQNHVDMVCDARPGLEFDFKTQEIPIYRDDNWLRADGTTLGADNGIGCAAALALIDSKAKCPPLNLLFTVEEETGLFGALDLDPKLLEGEFLFNLDGEDFGQFFIGCAGGKCAEVFKMLDAEELERSYYKLEVKNFKGGHSGVDIHLGRQNAILYLLGLLKNTEVLLSEAQIGKAHNIIPRDGEVFFTISGDEEKTIDLISSRIELFHQTMNKDDLSYEVNLEKCETEKRKFLSEESSKELINFVTLFPSGVFGFESDFELPLTSLSANLAKFILKDGEVFILNSFRFNDNLQADVIESKLKALSELGGFELSIDTGYPGWKPDINNPLISLCNDVFRETFQEVPTVLAMHAGLECGVLIAKKQGLPAISFGPDIRNAHSPDECVDINSVEQFWRLLKAVMAKLS